MARGLARTAILPGRMWPGGRLSDPVHVGTTEWRLDFSHLKSVNCNWENGRNYVVDCDKNSCTNRRGGWGPFGLRCWISWESYLRRSLRSQDLFYSILGLSLGGRRTFYWPSRLGEILYNHRLPPFSIFEFIGGVPRRAVGATTLVREKAACSFHRLVQILSIAVEGTEKL